MPGLRCAGARPRHLANTKRWRSLVARGGHQPNQTSSNLPAFLQFFAFGIFIAMQWWKRRRITKVIGSSRHALVLRSYSLCPGSQRGGADEEEDMNTSAPVISRTTFNEGEYLHYCYNLSSALVPCQNPGLLI